jgi:transposase-like protein
MPAPLPEDKRRQIEAALLLPNANLKQIAAIFGVSESSVKNIKKRLGLTAKPDGQTEGKPRLIKQAHGGALLAPDAPRPVQRIATKPKRITLAQVSEWFAQQSQDNNEKTNWDVFMQGMLKNAIDGKEAYASMLLSAIEKVNPLTPGLGPGGKPIEKQTILDPLFADMPDDELDRHVKRLLLSEEVIDAEFEEEDAAEEVAVDA